jgi:glycosyltransferase involved in cell wall biosynthesis
MKIAVFHNFLDNIGGAEIVTLTLARELNADVYTTNIDLEKIKKMGFSNLRIFSIGKIPINAPFRHQLALLRFKRLNLKNKYDFFIVAGDWAVSGLFNNKPNLWYVHSPPRELWDLYEYVRNNLVPWQLRFIYDLWVLYNRFLYRKYVKHTEKITCNSENTKNRLKKFLKRKAVVINPPIETSGYYYKKTGDYWLSVNRLLSHKRVELQVKAFSKLPKEKLVIIGCYEESRHFKQYADHINKIKPKNVEIKSWITYEELIDLYANCKGFITTSKDEDFGMTPLEAMASGKPVIAPNEGGYKETVTKKTGILIDDINPEKIIQAIKQINSELKKNPKKYKKECIKQAKNFDTKVFIDKIKKEIDK